MKIHPSALTKAKTAQQQFSGAETIRRIPILGPDSPASPMLKKIRGPEFTGKDEFGKPVATRPASCLKMEIGAGFGVLAEFQVGEKPPGLKLGLFKRGKDRNVQKCKADMFKMLRALKQLRQAYEREPLQGKHGFSEEEEYSRLRECCLRAERDARLVSLLNKWTEDTLRYGYDKIDLWILDRHMHRRILLAWELAGETRYGLAVKQIQHAIGKLPDLGNALESKKRLRVAEGLINSRQYGLARDYIFEASESIGRGKPWWVSEELKKTGDRYADEAVWAIETATAMLMERRVISRGAELFSEAALKLYQE